MICIQCNRDSKYKDRAERTCPYCMHAFAFEPRKGDKLTDKAFQTAILQVSANGKLRWGVEHLYYEVARRYRNRTVLVTLVAGAVLTIALTVIAKSGWAFVLGAVATVALAIWLKLRSLDGSTIRLSQRDFDAMWKRWIEVHGAPAGLIVRAAQPPKPQALAADVGDYSFDRAVICDRARTVDLLIANNFHFENNCAVLAMNGYPAHAFDTVRKMLLRNPRLQVYALHDASAVGCRISHRLANDAEWFKNRARVIDVGMRPSQAKPISKLCLPAAGPVSAGQGTTAREAKWLSRLSLELAAFRPEHILKALFRAINERAKDDDWDGEADNRDPQIELDDSLSKGAETLDDSGDSFG